MLIVEVIQLAWVSKPLIQQTLDNLPAFNPINILQEKKR